MVISIILYDIIWHARVYHGPVLTFGPDRRWGGYRSPQIWKIGKNCGSWRLFGASLLFPSPFPFLRSPHPVHPSTFPFLPFPAPSILLYPSPSFPYHFPSLPSPSSLSFSPISLIFPSLSFPMLPLLFLPFHFHHFNHFNRVVGDGGKRVLPVLQQLWSLLKFSWKEFHLERDGNGWCAFIQVLLNCTKCSTYQQPVCQSLHCYFTVPITGANVPIKRTFKFHWHRGAERFFDR